MYSIQEISEEIDSEQNDYFSAFCQKRKEKNYLSTLIKENSQVRKIISI